ncbi:hypothetical protein DFAR_800004 [Desulfarculales bacterium]
MAELKQEAIMGAGELLAIGLGGGATAEVFLEVAADRGAEYPFRLCSRSRKRGEHLCLQECPAEDCPIPQPGQPRY